MDSLLETSIEYTYYQYQKDLGLPIFVRADLGQFEQGLPDLLEKMHFNLLSSEEVKSVESSMLLKNSRMLTLSIVTSQIERQLAVVQETDLYGSESMTSNQGHQVYRFKNTALMMFASLAREWKMGIFSHFGNDDDQLQEYSILNRYLGLALAPFGIIGFWGVPVDEGVVVLKQSTSKGEAIYIDALGGNILSIDGNKKMNNKFSILKLSSSVQGMNKRMSVEELFSFLSNYCTYFDSNGHSMAVRQSILKISKHHTGLIYPSASFRPRTDLVL